MPIDPVTATEMFDNAQGCYPTVEDAEQGLVATRFFRVNTHSPVLAINATGLPRKGDSHPDVANLFCTSVRPKYRAGTDTATNNGWHYVTVGYAANSFSGDSSAVPGQKFTEYSSATQQAQVIEDISGNPVPPSSKEVNLTELKVVAYVASELSSLQAFVNIQNKINGNSVDFPRIRGFTDAALTAAPGQLLARSCVPEVVEGKIGLVKLTYTFGYGPPGAFLLNYRDQDADGKPVGPVKTADIQGTVNYPALW